MMDAVALDELEELILCQNCKQKFNDTDHLPKLLPCKHYFCLNCIHPMMKGDEVFCVNCWRGTELAEQGPKTLPTYNAVLQLATNFTNMKLAPSKPPEKDWKGDEVFCVNCWRGTELAEQGPKTLPTYNAILQLATNFTNMKLAPSKPPEKEWKMAVSENCCRHGMSLSRWCSTCRKGICATLTNHRSHQTRSHAEGKEQLISDVHLEMLAISNVIDDITHLNNRRRDFLLKVAESYMTLKSHVKTILQNGWNCLTEIGETRVLLTKARLILTQLENPSEAQSLFSNLNMEKQRLQAKVQDMYFQCQLADLICNSIEVLDFSQLKQAVANFHTLEPNIQLRTQTSPLNPLLFLTNFCMSQLHTNHMVSMQHIQQNGNFGYMKPSSTEYDMSLVRVQQQSLINVTRPSNSHPLFYFNIEVNKQPYGRIVIETRPDVAPKMSKNFAALSTGARRGLTYKGCTFFYCWDGYSITTGDVEYKNGRGGRSIYETRDFTPEFTDFPAVRGAVGMRHKPLLNDNSGLVGSQFRMILQKSSIFTSIFGHVVEGIELVEKIASFGDRSGRPTESVVIVNCGKLN